MVRLARCVTVVAALAVGCGMAEAQDLAAEKVIPHGILARVVPEAKAREAKNEQLSEDSFVKLGVALSSQVGTAQDQVGTNSVLVVRFYKGGKPVAAKEFQITGAQCEVGAVPATTRFDGNDHVYVCEVKKHEKELKATNVLVVLTLVNGAGPVAKFYGLSNPRIEYTARIIRGDLESKRRAFSDDLRLDQFVALEHSIALSDIAALPAYGLRWDDLVVVRAFRGGEPLRNQDASLASVVASTTDYDPAHPWVVDADEAKSFVLLDPGGEEKVMRARQGTVMAVTLRSPEKARLGAPLYLARTNRADPYGVALGRHVGLWFPVGLVGTNFKKTSDGLVFTAAPVSLAIGSRIWMSRANYMGLSGTFSYAVSNVKKNDAGDTSEFTLQTFAVGGLLDLSGWLNVGGTYVKSFGDAPSPGWMLVVGAGPKFVSLGKVEN